MREGHRGNPSCVCAAFRPIIIGGGETRDKKGISCIVAAYGDLRCKCMPFSSHFYCPVCTLPSIPLYTVQYSTDHPVGTATHRLSAASVVSCVITHMYIGIHSLCPPILIQSVYGILVHNTGMSVLYCRVIRPPWSPSLPYSYSVPCPAYYYRAASGRTATRSRAAI